MKGKFITFEGSEGSGKSTQIMLLAQYLKNKRKKVLVLREPGGVMISEKIRDILLDVDNKKMSDVCEMLLYMAARAQLVEEVIAPALTKGMMVLCDRFLDSTLAYQGYGNGVDLEMIKKIGSFATKHITPDLTFVCDMPARKGLSRIRRVKDRIEQRKLAYHNRVRRGYLDIAKKDLKRVKVLQGDNPKEEIHARVISCVERLLKS